jgi:hypothetical protein
MSLAFLTRRAGEESSKLPVIRAVESDTIFYGCLAFEGGIEMRSVPSFSKPLGSHLAKIFENYAAFL